MNLFTRSPREHQPTEVCTVCGQFWPCHTEQARRAGQQAARDALVNAARLVGELRKT